MQQEESGVEELRQEVQELKDMTADTNRQVHKMRRSARVAMFFQLVWWLSILGITGAAYYYYIQPYVQKVESIYTGAQHGASQAQDWGEQLRHFFEQYFTSSSTGQ